MDAKIPVDIISGFLGSGKTTLINAFLADQYNGMRIAVIENEFGKIDVDSAVLPEDLEITKITGGCVCCTLKISLIEGIRLLAERYHPNRIVIETTGVAKLSDVISAVQNASLADTAYPAACITVVNPAFHKSFGSSLGAFYNDQIESAGTVYISRANSTDEKTMDEVIKSIKELGRECEIVTEAAKIKIHKNTLSSAMETAAHDENHSHHDDAEQQFISMYIETPVFSNREELLAFINKIESEYSPKKVYRIKGTVTKAGESVLVQWVSGELELLPSKRSDNKIVVVMQA